MRQIDVHLIAVGVSNGIAGTHRRGACASHIATLLLISPPGYELTIFAAFRAFVRKCARLVNVVVARRQSRTERASIERFPGCGREGAGRRGRGKRALAVARAGRGKVPPYAPPAPPRPHP
ncbi:hypothetical protein ACJJTC_013294 [Scirpophaga incertulas]